LRIAELSFTLRDETRPGKKPWPGFPFAGAWDREREHHDEEILVGNGGRAVLFWALDRLLFKRQA
jgi:hypothetical protein